MFIPSSELKKLYSASGSFFNLRINSHVIKCRNFLDIYQKGSKISSINPEAFVIMMNPGNSKPILGKKQGESNEIPEFDINSPDLLFQISNNSPRKAKPDSTQYQVMRLMEHYGWRYVRVLNLSDIRNTKSREFAREYKKLDNTIHSIFLGKREDERKFLCSGIEQKPVIVAWGVLPGLKELAVSAKEKLPSHIRGIQGKKPYLYYHPLPRGKKTAKSWLMDFINGGQY
ncbi:hypothetical protein [uncultured Rossellomorea sp.]|uniref:hypothetical protein n=1 Tax=uncultured Rossellomorea sp. TaxID=2837549 RepID=UPI00262263E2|nr:hypothetical protein [uncultured Rossellomorea sp.]